MTSEYVPPQDPLVQCPYCGEYYKMSEVECLMYLHHVDTENGFSDVFAVDRCPRCGGCHQLEVNYTLSSTTTRMEVDI